MCEYCSETKATVTKLDGDEETECEWISEELGPGACDKPAVYFVSEWYVEEHLCAMHKSETENEMKEGVADFLEAVGFSSELEMRPIQAEETCDSIVPAGTGWKPCDKKAVFAKYVLNNSALCAEHVAELGYKTPSK